MTSDASRLIRIFASSTYVLLDFDGPVCSLFAGMQASSVAAELQALIADQRVTRAAELVGTTPEKDPLLVLRRSADTAVDVRAIEKALRAAEVRAAYSAAPTAGARDFLAACKGADRPVTIVSNNSADSVAAYVEREDLSQYVAHIVGRDPDDPGRMKPDPYLVERALSIDGTSTDDAVLIGDSPSDVAAAQAVGVRVIGYANKPGKADRLARAGAEAIVTSMRLLAEAMEESGLRSNPSSVSGPRP